MRRTARRRDRRDVAVRVVGECDPTTVEQCLLRDVAIGVVIESDRAIEGIAYGRQGVGRIVAVADRACALSALRQTPVCVIPEANRRNPGSRNARGTALWI